MTLSFTTDGSHSGTPTVTLGGNGVTATNTSGNTYTASYTLQAGDTEGAVSFSIDAVDAAGNAMTQVTATTDSSSVSFDETAPALTAVSIASDNSDTTLAKVGDTVTLSFTTDGSHSGTPTVTLGGNGVTVTNTSGNTYTASYTLQAGDTEGAVSFTIDAVDAAGNAMTQVTATTDSSSVSFDTTAPALTAVSIASDNSDTALAKTGDTVTLSFTTDGSHSGTPTVTLGGNSVTATNTSGNTYTASYTLQAGDIEGTLSFTIDAVDAAGNAMTQVTATTDSSSVSFDETAPALTAVSIASDNSDTTLAKVGDTVTLSFTTDGSHSGTPTVTLGGNSVTATNTSGNTYTASYTLQAGDTEGAVSFTIDAVDAAGNAMTQVTATTDSSSVSFDTTAPALTAVSIASDNSDTALAKTGDTVTLSFTTDGSHSGTPTVTLGGNGVTATNTSGNTYTASYTLQAGDTEGAVSFTIDAVDAAGNAMTQVTATTDSSSVSFDETAPALTAVSIASDNSDTTLAKVGDTVTLSFTTDGSHSGTPTVTLGGNSVTATNTSGNTYTASYTLQAGDTEGAVSFTIDAVDAAGNAMTQVTATTDSSSVSFDDTAPALTAVSIASDNSDTTLAKVGIP
ncbi:hypothetical protein D5085_15815 [Ectothiorhodospiraceae bacterium BW-2]|nr:hypothetical protein D5085_15815 [Ectothiorhodospiraceae bacterium BW-2]